MHKNRLTENRTAIAGAISGLCAAIAALLIVGLIIEPGKASNTAYGKYAIEQEVGTIYKANSNNEDLEGHVIAALPVGDYSLLRSQIKRGTLINIIGIDESDKIDSHARTILRNIKVVDFPKDDNSSLRENAAGLLVLLTQEESERLYGVLGSGNIRIVISGNSVK